MKERKRNWIIETIALSFIAFLLSSPVLAGDGEPNLYHQGLALGLKNQFGEAAKTLGRIPKNDNTYYDAGILIRVAHGVDGKTISAEAGSLMFSAMQHIIDRKYDQAGPDIDRALMLAPKSALAYDIHGVLNRHLLKRDKALEDFGQAVELDPTDTFALGNRGILYRKKKQYDVAIAEFTKSLAADPDQPRTYYNRGRIYYLKKDHEHALADFSSALKADPRYVNAFIMRGRVYIETEQLDQATDDFNAAKAIAPENGRVYEELAVLYLEHKNDSAKGCEYLHQACRLGRCSHPGRHIDDRQCKIYIQVPPVLEAGKKSSSQKHLHTKSTKRVKLD